MKVLTWVRGMVSLSFGVAFVGWAARLAFAPFEIFRFVASVSPTEILISSYTVHFLWLDIIALFVSGVLLLNYGIEDMIKVIKYVG